MTNWDDTIESDLRDVYSADVPAIRFDPQVQEARAGWTQRFGGVWRPAVAAAGLAAALSAVLIAPGVFGGESQSVSAAEVFEKASEAAATNASAGDVSYHMISTQEVHGAPGAYEVETWYDSAGRYRTEFRDSQEAGSGYVFGQVVNGDEAWLYQVLDGTTYAVHGPSDALGVGPSLRGGQLGGGTSLAEVLALYTGNCQTAELNGTGELVGRAVYIVAVRPSPNSCEVPEERLKAESLGGMALWLWVDQETFLTLQTQQIDATGVVSYSQTVSELTVGAETPQDLLTYVAPAGTTVVEATDPGTAKDALGPQTQTADATPPAPKATCTVTVVEEDGAKREDAC